jgi:single-strand DNA-binding protein
MAKDLNQCNFIGRLGKDVELKYMASGSAVANFSIACSDDYKNKNTGEKVEQTNWINVVAFGRLAEIIGEYCHKGSRVFVSGKQSTRKWQDQSGADKWTTEITANDIQMLDGKPATQQSAHQESKANGYAPDKTSEFGDMDDFDVPF